MEQFFVRRDTVSYFFPLFYFVFNLDLLEVKGQIYTFMKRENLEQQVVSENLLWIDALSRGSN